VEALKAKKITKPVVAWVSGTCATLFKSEVQFGHAGAKSGGAQESAQVRGRESCACVCPSCVGQDSSALLLRARACVCPNCVGQDVSVVLLHSSLVRPGREV
jgi:hypothetical protein